MRSPWGGTFGWHADVLGCCGHWFGVAGAPVGAPRRRCPGGWSGSGALAAVASQSAAGVLLVRVVPVSSARTCRSRSWNAWSVTAAWGRRRSRWYQYPPLLSAGGAWLGGGPP